MVTKIRILCIVFFKGKIIFWRVLIDKDKVGILFYCVCICVFFFLESLDFFGFGVCWGGVIIYILFFNFL